MNTRAGPVAKAGMLCANGAKIKQAKNSTATVTAVNPVFPPSLIPAPDSIYDVVFDVPNNAPTVVAVESANNALSIPSTSPFLFTLPVKFATEVSVPAVSKKSTNKNAKELLRRLHTKKNNKVFSGVDAFIEMWLEIPKYRFLAKIIRKPIIYQISWVIYEAFALILFYKNKNQLNKLERI